MPGFTTHYLFGEHTIKHMELSFSKDCLSFHDKPFQLGLQGPDIFFYYFPATLLYSKNIGNIIHECDSKKFFRCLFDARNRKTTAYEKDICDAYICGFMGHYTLDSICHPYVYYRSHYKGENQKGYFGHHVHLETDIDTVLLQKDYDLLPTEFSQHNTIAVSKQEKNIIAGLLHDAISHCFPEVRISKAFIRHAIDAVLLETTLMVDPNNWKKKLVRSIEQRLLGYATISALIPSDYLKFYKDPCNLSHKTWHNPWDKSLISRASVLDLMEQGEPILQKRIQLCYENDYDSLLLDLGNNSYLNGLPLS